MSDGHLRCINMYKHQIDRLNDKAKSVHSALYRAEPIASQSAASEINRILTGRVNEPAATK